MEINIMMKLKNPNIVKFLDKLETDNNYYIIQELCEDGDLAKQFIHLIEIYKKEWSRK